MLEVQNRAHQKEWKNYPGARNNKETKKLVHLLEWTVMYYVVIVINSIA